MTSHDIPTPFDTTELAERIGKETRLGDVDRATVRVAGRLRKPSVTTLHVTCSDGLEHGTTATFRNIVSRDLTQAAARNWAPLRTANLGGRYEWGSSAVALSHFQDVGESLAIVKVNSHVGVQRGHGEPTFGHYDRTGNQSGTCGALTMLLQESNAAFLQGIELMFASEGKDRHALLVDPGVLDPALRMLYVAVVQARLEARRALLDLAQLESGPDALLVVSAVTFNQQLHDHELLVGFYAGERDAEGQLHNVWCGLPDDPRAIAYAQTPRGVQLTVRTAAEMTQPEPRVEAPAPTEEPPAPVAAHPKPAPKPPTRIARGPREHRALPAEHYFATKANPAAKTAPASAQGLELLEALDKRLNDPEHPWTSLAIKGACLGLGEVLAVPALLTLFAGGALELHHAFQLHKVAAGKADEDEVQELLDDAADDLAARSPEEARELLRGAVERTSRELEGDGATTAT